MAQDSPNWLVFEKKLEAHLGHVATPSQAAVIYALARFIGSQKPKCVFLIKGYAGTGKTTLVATLVKTLSETQFDTVLLAPTGRAAKVLGGYAGRRASTIHRRIYFQKMSPTGGLYFERAYNASERTVFVVDEASMIAWENYNSFGQGNLLEDLFEYVFSGRDCKLVLIGDGAQLPPVGSTGSPALDLPFLQSQFTITAAMGELRDVVRQAADSGILDLATTVRSALFSPDFKQLLPIRLPDTPDVMPIHGGELPDVLESTFSEFGQENVILISRSNSRCNIFNQQIRQRILYREDLIAAGDYIMAVKNNYTWLEETSAAGFIANGDVLEVLRISRQIEVAGFQFAHVNARMIDYPDEQDVELVIWLDCLSADGPSMKQDAVEKLRNFTKETYADLPSKAERQLALKSDPYYNALQVKFAYALTCHKAQGGQWPVVIVDQGYLTEEHLNTEWIRWFYTAVTRATQQLYLLNFSPFLIEKTASE